MKTVVFEIPTAMLKETICRERSDAREKNEGTSQVGIKHQETGGKKCQKSLLVSTKKKMKGALKKVRGAEQMAISQAGGIRESIGRK